jgi:hypothetical protein
MKANNEQLSARPMVDQPAQKAHAARLRKPEPNKTNVPTREAMQARSNRAVREKAGGGGFAFHEPTSLKKSSGSSTRSPLVSHGKKGVVSAGKHGFAFHEPSLPRSKETVPAAGKKRSKIGNQRTVLQHNSSGKR